LFANSIIYIVDLLTLPPSAFFGETCPLFICLQHYNHSICIRAFLHFSAYQKSYYPALGPDEKLSSLIRGLNHVTANNKMMECR